MKSIPVSEREHIKTELVEIAEGLRRKHGLTIPESRRTLHELVDVSV
jgi:hypothetical protein